MAGGASLFAGSRVIPLVEDEPGGGRVENSVEYSVPAGFAGSTLFSFQ